MPLYPLIGIKANNLITKIINTKKIYYKKVLLINT